VLDERSSQVAEEVAHTSYGRLLAYVAARTGDLAGAEDALADAFERALRTWPERGVPDRPEAWLLTVARRRLIEGARHSDVEARAVPSLQLLADEAEELAERDSAFPDERLRLLFVCAHPAIDIRLHAPLMLQTVLRVDAARVASAFLVSPATMSQRLVRAKAKIRDAGIGYRIPEHDELPERLDSVLVAIYAAYGTGWDGATGDPASQGLADEAIRLARLVVGLLPDEPESEGLLALLLFSESRRDARRSDTGAYVPLTDQDTSRWSRPLIAEARDRLARAASGTVELGRFQLEAAIQSVHAARLETATTDWAAIVALYQGLLAIAPSIGAEVGAAAALAESGELDEALARLDRIDPARVEAYQPYWAVRAEVLRRSGHHDAGTAALHRAIGLSDDLAVRAFLVGRLPHT
jgi:RNA polymerase sigma-70 factor (ECF subfamily)